MVLTLPVSCDVNHKKTGVYLLVFFFQQNLHFSQDTEI